MTIRYRYKHIIVVHGIGDQAPNETALGFMNEFIHALPQNQSNRLTVNNLIESVDHIRDPETTGHKRSFQPANIVYSDATTVNVIGFSEVYWQPITDQYFEINRKNLPIPIFTWAHSISTRLLEPGRRFAQWRSAIENLEKTLQLAKQLAALSKKLALFNTMLEKFLGDVQMYAESDQIRQEINQHFFHVIARVGEFSRNAGNHIVKGVEQRKRLMQQLAASDSNKAFSDAAHNRYLQDFAEFNSFADQDIDIYVIAHSEGTVVAYNSLVWAAMVREDATRHSNDDEFTRAKSAYETVQAVSDFDWLPKVKGLVTLGSPLDKHFLIWRSRFRKHLLSDNPPCKIPWQNYTDANDPVGYELTELKKSELGDLPTDAIRMFDNANNDHCYKRYLIPGKAHVDYWSDRAIYKRIIRLMDLSTEQPPPLNDRWWAKFLPLLDIPLYAGICLLLAGAGAFFLYRFAQTLHWGYLPGLFITVLLWRLHACLHRGLLQLWRYTRVL